MTESSRPRGDPATESGVLEALGRFGLDQESLEAIERLPQRITNANFRVRADGRRWVLKRHADADTAERLRIPHEIELRLAESGFPVASLQRASSGATVVAEGEHFYTLHTWVDGLQIASNRRDDVLIEHPDLHREVATTLGRYHRLAHGFGLTQPRPSDDASRLRTRSREMVSWLRHRARTSASMRALSRKPDKTAFDRWILATLPEIRARADKLAQESKTHTVDESDVIVIHNDVNWENLVFDDRYRVIALLDFDNAKFAPRALEVGAAAVAIAGPGLPTMRDFVSECIAASGLDTDGRVVALGMRLRCVRSILWSIETYLAEVGADDEVLFDWCVHLRRCLHELDLEECER